LASDDVGHGCIVDDFDDNPKVAGFNSCPRHTAAATNSEAL
jgi:hypothetical protein